MRRHIARGVLRNFMVRSDHKIVGALDALLRDKWQEWLARHPELLVHPRDSVDESTFGVHQTWECNLMPYRELVYHGRALYLFDAQLEELLG